MLRLRFSLRSLILAVILGGGSIGIWYRWEPWTRVHTLNADLLSKSGTAALEFRDDAFSAVWNTSSGKEIGRLPKQSGLDAWSPMQELSHNGRRVIERKILTDDIPVFESWRVFDITGEKWYEVAKTKSIVSFSPDAHRAVLHDGVAGLSVVDVDTGARLVKLKGGYGLRAPEFSADGDWIACTSQIGLVDVWNVSDGSQCCEVNHLGATGVIFSPDAQYLVTVDYRRPEIFVWERPTGKFIAYYLFPAHSSPLTLRITSNNRWLIARANDVTILMNLKNNQRTLQYSQEFLAGSSDSHALVRDERFLTCWDLSGDIPTHVPSRIPFKGSRVSAAQFINSNLVAFHDEAGINVWSRRRSEGVIGIMELPELWIASFSLFGLIWSLFRDRKNMKVPTKRPAL